MSGYWIVMAIAALAVVAVVIAILTDEDAPGGVEAESLPAIAAFGVGRLPDGSAWVSALRAQTGAATIIDHTSNAFTRADLRSLLDEIRAAEGFAAAIVALPAAAPGDDDAAAWEDALASTLSDLRQRDIATIVLVSTAEHPADAEPSHRWHATVARLATAAGALVLTTGENGGASSEADVVADGALAWIGGQLRRDSPPEA